MSNPTEGVEGQPPSQSAHIEAQGSGRQSTRAVSPAQIRANRAWTDDWIALIRAVASNLGALIFVLGLVIVFGVAVCHDRKDSYAPICALLGTVLGIWLKGIGR